MTKPTERYEIKLYEKQIEIISELRKLNICPSKFIRLALEEKFNMDYKALVKKRDKLKLIKVKEKYF